MRFTETPWQRLAKSLGTKTVASIFAALPTAFAVRSTLPSLTKSLIQNALADLNNLTVDIEDIDLQILRGKVILKNVWVRPRTGGALDERRVRASSLRAKTITVFLSWRELMAGAAVCDVVVDEPLLDVYWPASSMPKSRSHPMRRLTDRSWQAVVRDWMPIKINRAVFQSGEIRFHELPSQNESKITLQKIYLSAQNLSNNEALASSLKATLDLEAQVLSGGWLQCHAKGFPIARVPTFDADLTIQGVDMREISFLFREFMGTRVDSGVLNLYAEAAAAQGKYKGYVKPVIDKMNVEQVNPGMVCALKALAFKIAAKLLRNRQRDRIATRLAFEGEFSDPSFSYSSAITSSLRNSFFEAFRPRLDHSIFFSREGQTPEHTEIAIQPKRSTPFSRVMSLFQETFGRWSDDKASRMSASLSYYTTFSLAPLLVLSIAVVGLVFGHQAAEGDVVEQMGKLVGHQGAEAIHNMIQAAQKPVTGAIATIVSLITLLVGASSVMSELKDALNKIWRVSEPEGIGAAIKGKILSYAMVLVIGFLLLVSLAISAALAAAGKFLGGVLPMPEFILQTAYTLVSFGVVTVLFAMIYKVLPDTFVPWRDVWLGSAVTSLLFSIGRIVISLYLGKASVTSSYGAAGSVMVLLLWVYYSAMIMYLGAEFTKVYSDRYGSHSST